MKIALFANVHANLPAFEALLQDLNTRKPDAIYCLGDLIGYNIWPNEVIGHICDRGIPTVAGKDDHKIRMLVTLRHHLTESGQDHAYHLVTPQNREYLITLPLCIRLD
jgi:Icc-related predicted phosphoesterase